jgi:ankyrin repeat protein
MAELPPCFEGRNPIMLAAEAGRSTEILDALMAYATTSDLLVRDSEGRNALMRCAMTPGRADQIRWLLDHGADPNIQNDSMRMSRGEGYNRTALMKAARARCHENLLAFLLVTRTPEAGTRARYRQFDPDITDDFGKTALDYAYANDAFKGSKELHFLDSAFQVNRLWKAAAHGSEDHLRDTVTHLGHFPHLKSAFGVRRTDGVHMLMMAAQSNPDPAVLMLLLDMLESPEEKRLAETIDLTETDDHGKTALDYAEQNEGLQGTEVLERLRQATQSRSGH